MKRLIKKSGSKVASKGPVTDAVKPVELAKTPRHIMRTASTVARMAANFGEVSDRDGAYLTYYKGIALRNGGKFTVKQIAEAEANGQYPNWGGSRKAHDAGVLQRLVKAEFYTVSKDGHEFTMTPKARSHA